MYKLGRFLSTSTPKLHLAKWLSVSFPLISILNSPVFASTYANNPPASTIGAATITSTTHAHVLPTTTREITPSSCRADLTTPRFLTRNMATEAKVVVPDTPSEQPELLKDAEVLDATEQHKYTLIFMHGLGDHGSSFVDVFEGLTKEVRVVLPNAPEIPITVNGGMRMPGWYDIAKLGPATSNKDGSFDREGIMKTVNKITELLDYEVAKVGAADRVVLAGFSQGGACSLLAGHNYKQKLGGIMCLSGYLLLSEEASTLMVQKDVPTLMYHGKSDQVVYIARARESKQVLDAAGVTEVEFVEEAGLGHSFSNNLLRKVTSFLSNVYKAAKPLP